MESILEANGADDVKPIQQAQSRRWIPRRLRSSRSSVASQQCRPVATPASLRHFPSGCPLNLVGIGDNSPASAKVKGSERCRVYVLHPQINAIRPNRTAVDERHENPADEACRIAFHQLAATSPLLLHDSGRPGCSTGGLPHFRSVSHTSTGEVNSVDKASASKQGRR